MYVFAFTDASKNINVKIYEDQEKINEHGSSKKFRGRCILSDEMVAGSTTPESVNRKKAFAVGFSILELSKLTMFRAWYDVICKTWPNARIITSDTDSYIFNIQSKNLNDDLKNMGDFWDFSTLDEMHPLYNKSNMNKLGRFKIEIKDHISSVCGVRPKVYSLETIDYKEFEKMKRRMKNKLCVKMFRDKKKKNNVKRLKGIKKHLIRQQFTHDTFKETVSAITHVSYFTIS